MDPNIDFDADVDFSVDGSGELDALNTAEKKSKKSKKPISRFSLFVSGSYGVCVFGVTGSILIRMNLSTTAHLTLASAMGLLVGWFAALLFHQLKNTTVDSSASINELAGKEAVVVLAIRPGSTGKVRVRIKEQDLEIAATSNHPDALDIDQRVTIVNSRTAKLLSPLHPKPIRTKPIIDLIRDNPAAAGAIL